jgi:hypothetical protein
MLDLPAAGGDDVPPVAAAWGSLAATPATHTITACHTGHSVGDAAISPA